jgi:hypothetical protein
VLWGASRVLTSVRGSASVSPGSGDSADARVLRQIMQRVSMTERVRGGARVKEHDDDAERPA